jgi:streptogrisin C
MQRNPATPSSRALAGLALALALALPATTLAADDPGRPVSTVLREALQRDLGLGPSQVARYLDLERRAPRLEAEARRTLGDSFGGAWLERGADGEFRLVVGSTATSTGARARVSGAEVRVVRHSLASLENGKALFDRRQGRAARSPALQSWHVDLPTNRVVLTVDPGATDLARAFIAESGLDPALVRIETSAQRPQPANSIRGGDRYNTPSSWCSIGFSVTQGGQTGFVTAGHCAGVGTAVSGANGVAIGNFAGSTFPGADYAWVRNTSGAWNIQPVVNNYAGGTLTVIGGMETGVGGAVCRSGARTGYRCGVVTAKNVTVNYSAGATFGLVRSSACVGGGDSGGSFITPSGEAQGVTSGGQLNPQTNENCSISNPVTFHQPLQPILNAYGLVLQTVPTCGRMNPGRVLTTGGAVSSCDGRFSLVIQGDGHLVLYQAGVGAIWWNNVFGAGHTLHMQTDGNLVVYNNLGQARWNTGTWGRNGATLYVQNDGNVVIYSHQGQALWWTGTGGR